MNIRITNTTARKLRTAAWVETEKPKGNWPQPRVLKNRLAMQDYKNELARQIGYYEGKRQIPENVAIGAEALLIAKAAGLEIGEIHKELGI